MLKIIYTETGLYLERPSDSLESWITTHVLLSVRAGINLCLQPTRASLLLKGNAQEVEEFMSKIDRETRKLLGLSCVDNEYLEVNLQGTWLDGGSKIDEGIFVTSLSDNLEKDLFELWQTP